MVFNDYNHEKKIKNAYLTIGSMCYFVNIIEFSTE